MSTTTVAENMGHRGAGVDPKLMCADSFAQFMRAYKECSNKVQAAVLRMCEIVNSHDATEEERLAALDTIAEALFPQNQNGKTEIDLEDWESSQDSSNNAETAVLDAQEATFAEKVQRLLKKKNMTQAELAGAVGIGQPAISMMLSRKCRPQRRTIDKIATVLGVPATQLWPK